MAKSSSISLQQLYVKVNSVLSDNLSLFKDFTIANISIDKELTPHHQWDYSFYTGTTKDGNKNYSVQLKISNQIILEYLEKSGNTKQTNASYDIDIEDLALSTFGAITITVKALRETGVSERELLRRRLEKFCMDHGYFDRPKRPLPKLVTSILALTSKYSEIHDDLLSNLNLNPNKITIINCHSSEEISKQITNADPSQFDIVVLYRGGREDEAMNMFSHEDIIVSVVNSSIPVCAALGHDLDTPFIYSIVDQTYSTPSAFGKGIMAHNFSVIEENDSLLIQIKNALDFIREKVDTKYSRTYEQIESLSNRLHEKVTNKIDKLYKDCENSAMRINDKANHRIVSNIEKIDTLVWGIAKSKQDFILSHERAIGYYLQDAYKNRITFIDMLENNIDTYVQRINENIRYKQTIKKEKSSKRKLYIAIVIMLAVIIGMGIFILAK